MKICRKIWIRDIEEIDFDEVGVHFTKNKNYTHRGGSSRGTTKDEGFLVTFIADGDFEINEDATRESNENYPHEREVVLAFDQELEATIKIAKPIDSYKWSKERGFERIYRTFKTIKRTINTGYRCDPWVHNV